MLPVVLDIIIIVLLLLIIFHLLGFKIIKSESESDLSVKFKRNPLYPGGGYFEVPPELKHLFDSPVSSTKGETKPHTKPESKGLGDYI